MKTEKARNRVVELLVPLASAAVRTYPYKIRSDLAQSCLEEMLKPYRLLAFDPSKGKALHFVRRCLRNLAINHYNKLRREDKNDIPFSSFGSKHTAGSAGGDGSGIPDSDKAVLSVIDNVQREDSVIQAVLDRCMVYARRRFPNKGGDYNLFCAVLVECLRHGVSFDSMEVLRYLSQQYGVSMQKVRYIRRVAFVMFKAAALDLGVVHGDAVSVEGRSVVDLLESFYPNNLFTEFAVLMGTEACSKLIALFGGSTLRVPTGAELSKSIVEFTIYNELMPLPDRKARKDKAQELADRFGMSRKSVMAKYRALKSKHVNANKAVSSK